jgi:hypothetical protein
MTHSLMIDRYLLFANFWIQISSLQPGGHPGRHQVR